MGKKNFKTELESLGTKLKEKEDTTPIQEVSPVKEASTPLRSTTKQKAEEIQFTVYIPVELMDTIREIGFRRKKKIKAIFVEALEEYVAKS
ncbi:hypothetical protein [Runella limosa]|uniref:hypothetical protein n=1 Tax=Runella limosa TaxID=370978 RepID=UPI00040908AC|nr:hypothetical protein [Runella limosa]